MARVVAELGRPETPEETAARKAESSRVYRSSQTFRNLIAALIATVAIVVIIVFAVPRGEFPEQAQVDAETVGAEIAASLERPVVVADVPAEWRVNDASVGGEGVQTWTVVYVPTDDPGFLRVSQGFDADVTWPSQLLSGSAPTGTVTIDGIQWDEYDIADSSRTGNVSYALSTQAGTDMVVVYGSATAESAALAAAGLSDQIAALREDAT